jgi:hypothetical protein
MANRYIPITGNLAVQVIWNFLNPYFTSMRAIRCRGQSTGNNGTWVKQQVKLGIHHAQKFYNI